MRRLHDPQRQLLQVRKLRRDERLQLAGTRFIKNLVGGVIPPFPWGGSFGPPIFSFSEVEMPENYPDDVSELIHWPREERNLEFKRSMSWSDAATKAKLTKSVLALANLRDGGHIVLGVERQPDDSYDAVGMQEDHLGSFVQDTLSAHFSEYADPFVEVTLVKQAIDKKVFCILRVSEFAELPVVCKKDGEKLRRGATYTRSRRMPETVEVPTQVEMREILDLAIEKRNSRVRTSGGAYGIYSPTPTR
jgi:hypothetical protein